MRRRDLGPGPERALAVLALSFCGACGGDHNLGGSPSADSPGEPPAIGLCDQGAELELIDDMEDAGAGILRTNGRAGSWFAFNNGKGEQEPMPDDPFFMAELDESVRSSRYAAWTRGSAFPDWGAGIGFEISAQDSYNASDYEGIAFWARRGPGLAQVLRADVTDRNTSPFGLVCDPAEECDPSNACDPSARACYDNFGAELELGEDWQFYSYRWDELVQDGWSGNTYPAITTTAIYGLRFQIEPEKEFEFWIDDVAFVCPAR